MTHRTSFSAHYLQIFKGHFLIDRTLIQQQLSLLRETQEKFQCSVLLKILLPLITNYVKVLYAIYFFKGHFLIDRTLIPQQLSLLRETQEKFQCSVFFENPAALIKNYVKVFYAMYLFKGHFLIHRTLIQQKLSLLRETQEKFQCSVFFKILLPLIPNYVKVLYAIHFFKGHFLIDRTLIQQQLSLLRETQEKFQCSVFF